ncbi:hypothetical protein [Neorhizobium sp. NCHU2750]|uniref:hypothetical protein n=1 Tax=Neorhizobium sp. NCHU2750 TaxID=1825976 RepID=UPI000EB78B9E|nr:hypothetical protein NCHU2750_17950 [Neorhizobium sp. NCHU2750]
MKYGFSRTGGDAALLRKGCSKVLSKDIDLLHVMKSGDELVADEITPIIRDGIDEYGWRVIKSEDVALSLTFDQEQTADYMKALGYTAAEVAKSLNIDAATVAKSAPFDSDRLSKAYITPANRKDDSPKSALQEAREGMAELAKTFTESLAKIKKVNSESDDAEEQLEAAAENIRKSQPSLTREQALSKAYSLHPELVGRIA